MRLTSQWSVDCVKWFRRPIFRWSSSICSCSAAGGEEDVTASPCEEDHRPWALAVAEEHFARRRSELLATIRRGIPRSFEHMIERYELVAAGSAFHRPGEVPFHESAPLAEMGVYLKESSGIDLIGCADPKRYADMLGGKACLGLTEAMWREDYFNRGPSLAAGGRLFQPEEFVVDGLIDLHTAEAMFNRPMDALLLWAAGWDEGYC